MNKNSVVAKKQFGQNFLIDRQVHMAIASQAQLTKQDIVVEIGPGLGHLTYYLVDQVGKLYCVEIDRNLAALLPKSFNNAPQLQVILLDVLKSKHEIHPQLVSLLRQEGKPYKVVANLPYNISAPVVTNFLALEIPPEMMIVTVQQEVGERLASSVGDNHYGPLSLMAAIHANVEIVRKIPPQAFYPQPKVQSCVVKIVSHPVSSTIQDLVFLKKLIRCAFNMKRKTIHNTLRKSPQLGLEKDKIVHALECCGIPPRNRPETIHLEQFIALANTFVNQQNQS